MNLKYQLSSNQTRQRPSTIIIFFCDTFWWYYNFFFMIPFDDTIKKIYDTFWWYYKFFFWWYLHKIRAKGLLGSILPGGNTVVCKKLHKDLYRLWFPFSLIPSLLSKGLIPSPGRHDKALFVPSSVSLSKRSLRPSPCPSNNKVRSNYSQNILASQSFTNECVF